MDNRGGQLQIAGVVVGNWGANTQGGASARRGRAPAVGPQGPGMESCKRCLRNPKEKEDLTMQDKMKQKHNLPPSAARFAPGYMFLTMPNRVEMKRNGAIR